MVDAVTRQYHEHGFVCPIPVLTAHVAAELESTVEGLATVCGIRPVRLPFLHRYFRWAYDLATHPTLLDVVERIVGPDILVWGTLVLSKAPGSVSTIPWHQDSVHSRFLDGGPALSAWIALTPATPESGCMRVIRGSRGPRLPSSSSKEAGEMQSRAIRVCVEIDESQAVDLELQPGEASLHEISLIHGSNANRSVLPRTGFIVRYATPSMQQPEYPVYCVRGNPGSIQCDAPPQGSPEENLPAYLEYVRSPAAQ